MTGWGNLTGGGEEAGGGGKSGGKAPGGGPPRPKRIFNKTRILFLSYMVSRNYKTQITIGLLYV